MTRRPKIGNPLHKNYLATVTQEAAASSAAHQEHPAGDQNRASFVQEAYDSWQAYQKDGLHLTVDETRAWLATWGSGEPAPTCHR
jgi:predicted transcriptional regulator